MTDQPAMSLARVALVGAGGGLRAWAPSAVLAAHDGGPFPGPARFIAWGAAAGEVIADKQPDMSSRWARRGLTLRVGSGVLVGRELAGATGAAVCAAAALTTAYAGSRLRSRAHGTHARVASGAAEDLLAYLLIILATSERR